MLPAFIKPRKVYCTLKEIDSLEARTFLYIYNKAQRPTTYYFKLITGVDA